MMGPINFESNKFDENVKVKDALKAIGGAFLSRINKSPGSGVSANNVSNRKQQSTRDVPKNEQYQLNDTSPYENYLSHADVILDGGLINSNLINTSQEVNMFAQRTDEDS